MDSLHFRPSIQGLRSRVIGRLAIPLAGALLLAGSACQGESGHDPNEILSPGDQSSANASPVDAGGVNASIAEFHEDSTRTWVMLRVEPPAGMRVYAIGFPVLALGGRTFPALDRKSDSERQLWTVQFPPIPAEGGDVSIEIGKFQVGDVSAEALDAFTRDATLPFVGQRITLKFTRPDRPAPSERIGLVASPSKNLSTEVAFTMSRVTVATSGTLVEGTISGVPEDQIPYLVLFPPRLADTKGNDVQFVSGRSGFGPNRASFKFRFAKIEPGAFWFTLPVQVQPLPHEASGSALATATERLGGASATFLIDVPRSASRRKGGSFHHG